MQSRARQRGLYTLSEFFTIMRVKQHPFKRSSSRTRLPREPLDSEGLPRDPPPYQEKDPYPLLTTTKFKWRRDARPRTTTDWLTLVFLIATAVLAFLPMYSKGDVEGKGHGFSLIVGMGKNGSIGGFQYCDAPQRYGAIIPLVP